MGLIAGSAALLALVRAVGLGEAGVLLAAPAFLAGRADVLGWLDPLCRAVLLAPARESPRRRILRLLAILGRSVLWWFALAMAYFLLRA